MKNKLFYFLTVFFLLNVSCAQKKGLKMLWQIGEVNHQTSELALGPSHYLDFLARDFGFEDRSFVVGYHRYS
jgi:hypothetical protein